MPLMAQVFGCGYNFDSDSGASAGTGRAGTGRAGA